MVLEYVLTLSTVFRHKIMKIVSACLAGINCRYDGKNNVCPFVVELIKQGKAIPVCPEQLGGLSTPREAAELNKEKVVTKTGKDVTKEFVIGAEEGLIIAKLVGCSEAILKARSPSCGVNEIYDGSFTKTKIKGNGVFAQKLIDNGIKVITEEDL
jgi:uncharacterized protein YbbK (DUF523 family)